MTQAGDPRDYYKHLSLFWTDILYLMSSKPQALSSAGPFRAMAPDAKKVATEIIEMNRKMMDFNDDLAEYYRQLAETWTEAQKKVDVKAPDLPRDQEHFDAYKRVWIDIFDNDFTELFDSKKFAENYGRMVSRELEMADHWNSITDTVLKSSNLPSKKDLDDIYREVHALRRRVAALESDRRKDSRKSNKRAAPRRRRDGQGRPAV